MSEREDILGRLDHFTDIQNELESILQTLVLNDSTIIDAMAQMFGITQKINARVEQSNSLQNRLLGQIESLIAAVAELQPAAQTAPIVVQTDAYARDNPEIALLQYLGAFIDDRTAIDVGAHVGEFAERLLAGGYHVQAFEPYPPSFERLKARLGNRSDFSAHAVAIGATDGEALLHIAHDVGDSHNGTTSQFHSLVAHPLGTSFEFGDAVPVPVRSLASLAEAGDISAGAGLLKIDSEGNDLDIIFGMGASQFAIVMTEFWDAEHAFGRGGHGHLAPIVEAMRARGYGWHVVIYHVDEDGVISYYFNNAYSVPRSWGNAIFFRDRSLFARAARWCEAALRPTVAR